MLLNCPLRIEMIIFRALVVVVLADIAVAKPRGPGVPPFAAAVGNSPESRIVVESFIFVREFVESLKPFGPRVRKKLSREFLQNTPLVRHYAAVVDESGLSRLRIRNAAGEFRYARDVDVKLIPEEASCR